MDADLGLGTRIHGLEVCVSKTSVPHDETSRQRRCSNNRATVRYRCAPATIGRLYVGEDHEFQHAWVVNLSKTGIGFVLARPIPCGTPVVIQMRANVTQTINKLIAQVVHCTAQLQNDWMIGCEFADPVSPELLDYLL